MSEPIITINSFFLNVAQSTTVRMAIEAFASDLKKNGLGDSVGGQKRCQAYLVRLTEIQAIMYKEQAP